MANSKQYWDFKPEVFVSKDQGQIELFVRGEGPPLILLHELPGLAEKTFELGDYFVKAGFKVILPLLFGRAGDDNTLLGFAKVCIRKEAGVPWIGVNPPFPHAGLASLGGASQATGSGWCCKRWAGPFPWFESYLNQTNHAQDPLCRT